MWRLENKKALLRNPTWTLELDVESPETGLSDLAISGPGPEQVPVFQRFGAKLLQIQSPNQDSIGRPVCESVYVRGADLVATYRMSKAYEICWQIYWRELAAEEDTIGGIELIVSVQTDLLDSDPRLYVGSRIANSAFVSLEPAGALLARPPQVSFSYLELIHPADFSAVEVTSDGADPPTCASRFHLFDDHLEKGVIRRARLRGLVLPRADDTAMATACYQSFLQSALPLTA